jgi:hypothetical protein
MKCIFCGYLCDSRPDNILICDPCMIKLNRNNETVALKTLLHECYKASYAGIEIPIWVLLRIEKYIDVSDIIT